MCSGLLACLLAASNANSATELQTGAWDSLNQGKVVALMRHAIAPGNGDPSSFILGDCNTQRNLSEQGRQQAQAIGLQMKAYGIARADIYTSQWCRCVDTGAELGLGKTRELPMLNSFYQDRSTAEIQTEQLRNWIKNRLDPKQFEASSNKQANPPAVLVTHQVNITALTGVFPASGEIVFVALENNQLSVVTTVVTSY